MTRLTDKNSIVPRDMMNAEYAKLADLEDIEQELGIDLITLFKALKNGFVYFINEKTYETCEIKYFSPLKEFIVLNKRTSHFCELKDYGKTWALTKEELENGKKM